MTPHKSAPPPVAAPAAASLAALATSADPAKLKAYRPTPSDTALAGVLFTTTAPSFAALAEAAGLSDRTLSRITAEPERAAWIVSRAAEIAGAARSAVYARILEMALTSRSPAWAKLFLERFDAEYASNTAPAGSTVNTQNNFFSGMSTDELKAFVEHKRRLALGAPSSSSS